MQYMLLILVSIPVESNLCVALINGSIFTFAFLDCHHALVMDLFERVVSGDVALFFKYFATRKCLSFVQLNCLLATFKCCFCSVNKPSRVEVNCEGLGGHADGCRSKLVFCMNPLLVGSRIADLDEVWLLCMLSIQLIEIVCAPKISLGMVTYLQCIIEEYVTYRKLLFPDVTLKPKHHFLVHYPGLIMKFGQLMRLWAMRFEAKHSYFKQCARAGQHFRNLPKTLAERHQLHQSFHSMGDLFPPVLQCNNGQPFSICRGCVIYWCHLHYSIM